jgi:radical SAM/Cys-rich protein
VRAARALGVKVIDRCNLTILYEPNQENLAEFLAENQVEVVASLPCYSLENVDKQRGKGTFDKSIAALQKLNNLGYGKTGTGLTLNLVYNPQGPVLPPNQKNLEADYKRELMQHFGIEFNQLFALTNMPIQRFGSMLISKGTFGNYLQLLKDNYAEDNLNHVIPELAHQFNLDSHHAIETGRVFPVCGNTYRMLNETRFAPHFEFIGDFTRHYGLFAGCGSEMPFNQNNQSEGGAACC